MESKDQVRSYFIALRKQFAQTVDAKAEAEKAICFKLQTLLAELGMKKVALYNSYGSEANISGVTYTLADVKWCYPKVTGDSLKFYTEAGIFEKSDLGVMEPEEQTSVEVPVNEIDCVLVPGVGFDHNGGRMGTGKGYFDRTLTNYSGVKIGVGFDVQFSSEGLPLEPHDIKMDYLVNEEFILKLNVGRD